MKRLHSLFLLIAGLLFGAQALAQMPDFTGKDPLTDEAEFSMTISKSSDFCVGDVVKVCFKGKINTDGWHLYSARDDGNISYNPTMLDVFLDESKGIKLKGKMTENKTPREKEDELMGGLIRDFKEHEVTFCQNLEITAENVEVIAELSAQTCTDAGMCKFLKLPFEWRPKVKNCGGTTPVENNGKDPVKSPETDEPEQGTTYVAPEYKFKPYDAEKSVSDNVCMQERPFSKLFDGLAPLESCAFYDYDQALQFAKFANKPLLMWFTGHSAASSRKMENEVFKDPRIKAAIEKDYVIGAFYVDENAKLDPVRYDADGKKRTKLGHWNTYLQNRMYNTVAQPFFAVVDHDGSTIGSPIGYTPDTEKFYEFISGGVTAFNSAHGIAAATEIPKDPPLVSNGTREKGVLSLSGVAEEEEDCSPGSLMGTFFLAFLVGLGAILTPCVFPMIPLTVSFFVKQGEEKKSGMRGAITYALSIVFIYGGLGLLISILFGPSALYTLGSHPIPNFIFFVLFLIFAISFLGAFDITLPSSWSTKMNSKAGASGILGPFFMALTLVIVSFSCTGPLLGAAVVGSTQGAACTWKPFMAMTGFGVAFGIPFGLLALFPSLLNKLPQAGGWMNTIKVVFGFLELALCMKFLSNVDLAMHWHILDRQVFIGIWIVVFILLGIYFLGKLTLPHDSPSERTSVAGLLFAVASFSFTMYLVPGLWGAPLSALEGLIPPANTSVGVKLLPHQVAKHDVSLNAEICKQDRKYAEIYHDREAHGFCMFYDLEQAIKFAREKKKPIFLDFTGHSCANCRKMENDVWPVEKVMESLKNDFVMVSLYADETARLEKTITTPDGKKLRKIADWVQWYQGTYYKTIAQPYYALIDYDESALVMPVGYTPDADKFLKYLKSGLKVFNERYGIKAE